MPEHVILPSLVRRYPQALGYTVGELLGSGSYAKVVEASLPDLMNKVNSEQREWYGIDVKCNK